MTAKNDYITYRQLLEQLNKLDDESLNKIAVVFTDSTDKCMAVKYTDMLIDNYFIIVV